MKRAMILTLVLTAAFLSGGCSYNDLTAKQQNVRARWGDIETSLQRRADLIPNLMTAARKLPAFRSRRYSAGYRGRSRLLNAQRAEPAGSDGDRSPEQREAIINAANSFGGTIGRC